MISWSNIYLEDGILFQKGTQVPFTGTVCYQSENVWSTLDFKEGKEDGELFIRTTIYGYYNQDDLTYHFKKGLLKKGEFIGDVTTYREDETIYSKGEYSIIKSDFGFRLRKKNEVTYFNEDGTIHRKWISGKDNDDFNFKIIEYFLNGEPSQIEIFKENISEVTTYFHENGNKESVCEYSNDKRNGFYRSFYKDGKTQSEGFYRSDLKDGKWIYYHKNGVIKSEGSYNKEYSHYDDGREGVWKNYNDKGQLIEITEYKCGSKHGVSKYLLPNHEWNEVIYHMGMYKGNNKPVNRFLYNLLYKL